MFGTFVLTVNPPLPMYFKLASAQPSHIVCNRPTRTASDAYRDKNDVIGVRIFVVQEQFNMVLFRISNDLQFLFVMFSEGH